MFSVVSLEVWTGGSTERYKEGERPTGSGCLEGPDGNIYKPLAATGCSPFYDAVA